MTFNAGMMDIALLTANANQLRFMITYNSEEKTFIISVALIVLSLFVQVAVGIGMIYKVCIWEIRWFIKTRGFYAHFIYVFSAKWKRKEIETKRKKWEI